MYNWLFEFEKEFLKIKKKDNSNIEKSNKRLNSDNNFLKKTLDMNSVLSSHAFEICSIIEELVANPVMETIVKKPFSKSSVVSILQDENFTAFMLASHLANRALKIGRKSKGDFKLRLYIAILNFDEYQKTKWCK